MKIDFTKEEYRTLVKALSIADWIVSAHQIPPYTEDQQSYQDLMNKVFSHCKAMDAEDIIKFDEETNEYHETQSFEETVLDEYIHPYDEEIFWEELIDRLSEEAAQREIGNEKPAELDAIKKAELIEKYEKQYAEEFENYGLRNLEIRETS